MIDLLFVCQYSFTDDYPKALKIVLMKIGDDWSKLILILDPEIDIDVIQAENPGNVFNQAVKAIKLWSQKHPKEATVANLERGLKEIKRDDIIDALKEISCIDL